MKKKGESDVRLSFAKRWMRGWTIESEHARVYENFISKKRCKADAPVPRKRFIDRRTSAPFKPKLVSSVKKRFNPVVALS